VKSYSLSVFYIKSYSKFKVTQNSLSCELLLKHLRGGVNQLLDWLLEP